MSSEEAHNSPSIKTILADKGLDREAEFWQEQIENVTSPDVESALAGPAGVYRLDKLAALISPAAEDYLEQMAQAARQLTIQRFGRTIKLYAPLYLSNHCANSCLYCGFNAQSNFDRTRLTIDQTLAEADFLAANGFSDILLVSGEDKEFISADYLIELTKRLREKFSSVSVEIYQLTGPEYTRLFAGGVDGVTIYQETYNRKAYAHFHPAGPKADYDKRLAAPDSIAAAGMRELGLGALLGLSDWRAEVLALAEHAHFLMKRYWQCHVSFSFPRLRPAHQVDNRRFEHLISDKNLVQMITALRLCFADAGLVISTRERAQLRDNLIKLGVTRLSAGSKTNPGGYSGTRETTGQFEIDDNRSPAQVADMIKAQGTEVVWKDWDKAFSR